MQHKPCKANPLLGAPPFLRDYSWFCQMTPWIIGQSFESCVWNRVLTCRLVNGARIMNFQCIWNRTCRLQVFFSWIWPSILTVRIPDLSWDAERFRQHFATTVQACLSKIHTKAIWRCSGIRDQSLRYIIYVHIHIYLYMYTYNSSIWNPLTDHGSLWSFHCSTSCLTSHEASKVHSLKKVTSGWVFPTQLKNMRK